MTSNDFKKLENLVDIPVLYVDDIQGYLGIIFYGDKIEILIRENICKMYMVLLHEIGHYYCNKNQCVCGEAGNTVMCEKHAESFVAKYLDEIEARKQQLFFSFI